MPKQAPLCRKCLERHWPKEACLRATSVTAPPAAVTPVTPLVADGVTPVMGRADVVTSVMPQPGEECPTCKRKMPSRAAMKQAAYRERKS